MNITAKLDHISSDFITQYLSALGIEDVKHYLKPIKKNYEDTKHYPNMDKMIKQFNHLFLHKRNDRWGIVVDSDLDGACSAAIAYMFLRDIGRVPEANIISFFHRGKQHGLKDMIDEILAMEVTQLIVPDAGSNDVTQCRTLSEQNIGVYIFDHHLIEYDNEYALIINNQMDGVDNKALSGTGVMDKFVRAFCKANEKEYPDYSDIVAVSLVGDICDLTTLENRAYLYHGLHNITNPFLKLLFDKLCQRRGNTPDGIGWNIAPLANALARSDEYITKSLFFDGLVGNVEPEVALKDIRRVKRKQDEEVKLIVEEIEPNLDVSTKVILGYTQAENASFIGLIANKFNGKYNKPTILLRDTGYNSWSGSLRSPVPLATKINESGLASAQGHEEACGILVKDNKLNEFQSWLETLDLSENPDVTVTASVRPEDITVQFCQEVVKWNELWGHGVEAPTFHIHATLTQDNVFVFEKSTTTLKLDINGLSVLKFFAKEADVAAFQEYSMFDVDLVVGELSVNEYNGYITPQCNLIKYEITPTTTQEEEDWEDWF